MTITITGIGTAAFAAASDESELVSLTNGSRASAGLPPLQMDGALTAYARQHTAEMIAKGEIFHSSSSQLSSITSGWSVMGENVGRGPSSAIIHQAFMNSAGHRANILGDFNYIGVGADRSGDGTLYVTVIFMKKETATTTTTTAPAPEELATEPAPLPAPPPSTSTAKTTASGPSGSGGSGSTTEASDPVFRPTPPPVCDPDTFDELCLD